MPTTLYPSNTLFPSDTLYPDQATATSGVLLVSFDDMNVPTHERTWTDLSDRLRSYSVQGGRDSELDEYDSTTCTLTLDNRDRELDPLNVDSAYYPNLLPNRRVRLHVHGDTDSHPVFTGYVDGWGPTWTGCVKGDATATVTCSDGMKILSMFRLPAASPDVQDYEEVVSFDDPTCYWRMENLRAPG